jgi:hypothetical protein
VHEPWITDFAAALRQGGGGAYVNFLGDEGEERIREAYPGSTWERLAPIKGRYDPTNLFRLTITTSRQQVFGSKNIGGSPTNTARGSPPP